MRIFTNACHRVMLLACTLMVTLVQPAVATASENWPMWRADAGRSASTTNALPDQWDLLWTRKFTPRKQAWDDPLNLDLMTYDRSFEPIVVDGSVLVGFSDQDKLVALDAATGQERWTYFAEGPVRLPPVGYNGNVYFCSDDGYLYCVRLSDGDLVWKFFGAPNTQHAIGNRRLISAWPARGGPVIYDGNVYFAASIWPFMGTFIYSLDAETGKTQWVNDSTGAQYIKQPHSAPSFAGVAPQGALVATEELLIVPGGRSVPAVFDRKTGQLKYFEINAGGKGTGGSFVTADASHYYVHTREKGTRAFNLKTGLKTAFTPNEPVLFEGKLYSAERDDDRPVLRAYDVSDETNTNREALWEVPADGMSDLVLAGKFLLAAGPRSISIVRLPSGAINGEAPEVVRKLDVLPSAASENVDDDSSGGEIVRLLVAAKQLFVVCSDGSIRAFGKSPVVEPANRNSKSSVAEVARRASAATQDDTQSSGKLRAQRLLGLGDANGYAFWYGSSLDPALLELSKSSEFEQFAIVDADGQRVAAARRQLDQMGLYGSVTVHHAVAHQFRAPKYVGNMVFVSSKLAESEQTLRSVYESVRPYGGVMVVLCGEPTNQLNRIAELDLEQADLATFPGGVTVRRDGALPGSADWTHQYGDVANTIKSDDARVKLPLGILWFGGSSNMDVLPRHGHGPPEQVLGGRLFIEGMNCLSARDVYTGRVLWKREFEDLRTFDVYYDSTYENVPLNPKYNQVHIPGANGRGTNYVVTDECIYLLNGATCLQLDPATGKDIGKIELPKNEDGSRPEWGYLGVFGDVLLGGIGFAEYRDRYDLDFDADKELKSNRAGFGSKSFDRAASRGLVAFDRHSGDLLWRSDAKHSYWHNGIVAGDGKVFCLDKNPTQIEDAMRRRGLSMPDSYRIVCLDVLTGKTKWEINEGIFGTWLGYSSQQKRLLQAGAQGSDRLYAEVGQGMRVYDAESGKLHWKKDNLRYAGPCILHNDLIITNANSYSESAGAFYLHDGSQKMVKHPLTGAIQPWKMTRAYGCNNIIASENLLTFRSGAAGYYDLNSNSGTGNLGGFKSGCTSNLVVANGVLNAPDYTRTCSCAYQNQTSLALVHMPEIEVWSVNALSATSSKEIVDSVGLNLGAAGDRRDADDVLWLEYPVTAGASPAINVEFNPDATVFQQHSAAASDAPLAWVASSGIDGLKEIRIELDLAEKPSLADGVSIAHPEDDAEENEAGEVNLTSSDLEMVLDGVQQQVGLRFNSIGLAQGTKIREAYLQFTCDEVTDVATSLLISGELSPDATRFASETHDISSRPRTRAQVGWTPPAWKKVGLAKEAQRSPDIARLVQEIVDQADWKVGNSMAFLVEGSGQRTAVAAKGNGKGAVKLIVVADSLSPPRDEPIVTHTYDLLLLFASPRDSTETRVFDVFAQGERIAEGISVPPNSQLHALQPVTLAIPRIEIGNDLHLEFHPIQGAAVLNGIRIKLTD